MSIHLLNRGAQRDLVSHWRRTQPAIPANLIVPINSTSAPTGWNLVTSGLGKSYLVPRHYSLLQDTYYNLEQAEQVLTASVNTAGAHSESNVNYEDNPGGAGWNADPGHDHGGQLSKSATYHPERTHFSFIQAASDQEELPANSFFLRYDTENKGPDGWTRYSTTNPSHSMLYMADTGNGGSLGDKAANAVHAFTIPTDGAHNHGGHRGGSNGGDKSCYRVYSSPGAHDHGGAKSITLSSVIRQHLFNLWFHTAAKTVRDEKGMLGFWRDTHLPTGWYVRTDLTESAYLSIAKNLADAGQLLNPTAGSNPALTGGPVTTGTDGNHRHYLQSVNQDRGASHHISYMGSHTHTLTLNNATWLPQRIRWAIIERQW